MDDNARITRQFPRSRGLALLGGARFRTVHAVSISPRRVAASGGRNHDSRFITSALNESDRRDHISSVRELALLGLREFA